MISNASVLKYGNSLLGLLMLLLRIQRAIIIVDISMYPYFSTILSYLRNQRRMTTQHYRGDKKGGCCIVGVQGVHNCIPGPSLCCFTKAEASKNLSEPACKCLHSLCPDGVRDKVHSFRST